jgi:predicted molibdopterin-dependent oxidoreductase YjgC
MWGLPLPARSGLEFGQMLEAARQGQLKGIYILGSDVLQEEDVSAALGPVEFLVVQDTFLRKLGKQAHVVLPTTSFLEQEGSFTNTEHRVQQLRPVKAGPDGVLPDWRILADLIERLQSGTRYGDVLSVYREIMRAAPFYAESHEHAFERQNLAR